nr:Ig-like domain-containing protein [bacterium]
HLSLVFSEPVRLVSVTTLSHYAIAPAVSILRAELLQDKKTVLLHTAAHQDGVDYTLTITGIQDSSKAANAMSATQFTYSFTLPIQAEEIAPAAYRLVQAADNDSVYIDRSYTLRTFPAALAGQSRIVTANNDKYATDAAFLTFRVRKHVHVYVAYDRDVTTPPFWLQPWTRTDWLVETSDSPFICYKKYFPPGIITLGGNEGVGSNSMYLVFITPAEDAMPPAPPTGLWAAPWAGQ